MLSRLGSTPGFSSSLSLLRVRIYAILAFVVPLIVYVLSLDGIVSSDYPNSILGMQYAMWANHTFSLGTTSHPLVGTMDSSYFQGRYYSALAPGFAFVSFPFAAVGFVLDGGSLNVFGYAVVMDELFLALASSLTALLVYKICRFYARPAPSLLAALTLAFCTPVWPFTTMIYIHATSMMFSAFALFLVLRHFKNKKMQQKEKEHNTTRLLYLSALSLAGASVVEYVAIFLFLPLFAYIVASDRAERRHNPNRLTIRLRHLLAYAVISSLGPILNFAYNYSIFGDPLMFPEQYWTGASGSGSGATAAVSELAGRFSLGSFLSHLDSYLVSPYRGIFLLSPVLVFGFYGLYVMSQSAEQEGKHWRDPLLYFTLFLAVLVPYSFWSGWGGRAYGPRYMILSMPFLAIPLALFVSQARSAAVRTAFVLAFIASSFIQGVGALTCALSDVGSTVTYQPIAYNIPWLVQGKFDLWWPPRLGLSDLSFLDVFTLLVFASIWCSAIVLTKMASREEKGRTSTLFDISSICRTASTILSRVYLGPSGVTRVVLNPAHEVLNRLPVRRRKVATPEAAA